MKIRCQGQSVRLRLGRSEVERVGRGENVEGRTVFAAGVALAVALRPAAVESLAVSAENGVIVVHMPAADATTWAASDAVGLAADVPAGDGLSLRVLIEKDFQCLDRTGDAPEDADAFPNPSAACR